MTDSKTIFITDKVLQPDGRLSITLRDGRQIANLAICCVAKEIETEDTFFYEIYFEVVKRYNDRPIS